MKVKIYHSYGPDRFEEVEDQPRKQVAGIKYTCSFRTNDKNQL